MKKIDLGQTITILANIGVIAGIVFLAFELQQNNEALGLQARLERENTVRQGLNRRVENPDLIRAAAKSFSDEELTLEEELLLRDYNRGALIDWWFAYRQVQDGALDENAIPLSLWREGFYEIYPRMPESWEEFKRIFSQEIEYIQWFEENVANR
jgi:hypothetical protein